MSAWLEALVRLRILLVEWTAVHAEFAGRTQHLEYLHSNTLKLQASNAPGRTRLVYLQVQQAETQLQAMHALLKQLARVAEQLDALAARVAEMPPVAGRQAVARAQRVAGISDAYVRGEVGRFRDACACEYRLLVKQWRKTVDGTARAERLAEHVGSPLDIAELSDRLRIADQMQRFEQVTKEQNQIGI